MEQHTVSFLPDVLVQRGLCLVLTPLLCDLKPTVKEKTRTLSKEQLSG